jgi:predicted aldo/keto reductase-like oxidoreductase
MVADKLPGWALHSVEDNERIFQEQLRRTNAGYFDFYRLHAVDDGNNYAQYEKYNSFAFAMQKKIEGKIKHLGFSFHGSPAQLERVLDKHPEVEFVQIQLNYLDWNHQGVAAGKNYEILLKRGIPIIVMEPVKGGTLANMEPDLEALMKEAAPQRSVASWALRFAGSLDGVMTILSGMSNEEQVRDNLATFKDFEPLSDAEYAVINKIVSKMLDMPIISCTSCRYCTDGCPAKIQIPDVFSALNKIRMYPGDKRPHTVYNSMVSESGRANACIACGKCEKVCPQHLSIIELMKEASGHLD